MSERITFVELKPGSGEQGYIKTILDGLETAKKEGIEVTALEIALDVQKGISELFYSLSINYNNPVYDWLCLAELCDLHDAYCQIEGIEKDSYFLNPIPGWIQVLLGRSAINLRAVVNEFQAAEQESIKKASIEHSESTEKPNSITGPKSHKKILEALYLIANGKNHFLQAARQGTDLLLRIHSNYHGLNDDEAAMIRQKVRQPEIFTDPASEQQGNKQAANRHDKLKLKEIDKALKPFTVVPPASKNKMKKNPKKPA